MAAEAEAAREARAKVIAAEGEQRASRALKEAADVINESPAALQVRNTLQYSDHVSCDTKHSLSYIKRSKKQWILGLSYKMDSVSIKWQASLNNFMKRCSQKKLSLPEDD